MKHCHQAPYGKGEKTLVDTNVRRVWRMEPDRFSLTNPEWKRFIAETVGKVQEELGLEKQKLTSHLYDLLLYEPGSFFLPHRDGEKLDRMVATLVDRAPLVLSRGARSWSGTTGRSRRSISARLRTAPFHIHFAAFYADCEHEVRPLRKGYRLCLVYNLTLAKSKKSISAPRDSEHIDEIRPLLREWAEDDSAREAGHHARPSVHQGRARLGCAEGRGSRQGASPRGSRAGSGLQGLSGAADPLRIGLGGGRRRRIRIRPPRPLVRR